MKKLKVVTIGGGSSYTPELVDGFLKRHSEFPLSELWLVDIEDGKEKLEIVTNLARRMVKKSGLPIQIYSTLDVEEALKDADFVTTQFRVGLLDARIKDERIPLSHGMIGQETNGAGGMFKAFRTIPVILDLIEKMKRLCPDAWLINFTNPAGIVTEAILRYTDFKKVVGLCNVPITMHMQFARLLGYEQDRLRLEISGVNHHIFVTDTFLDGVSIQDEIVEKYCNLKDDEVTSMKNIMANKWSESLIRSLNAIPCPYFNYYYFTKETLEQQLKDFSQGKVRGQAVSALEKELFEIYKDENLDVKPVQLEQRGGAHYSDAACNLITSIYTNKCDIQYVNCQNRGAVTNLPYESAIEVAAVITKDGPKPIAVGELPYTISGTIQMIKSFERMVCEAAVKGDRNLAVAALNLNPLVTSDAEANVIVNELLEAHKKYLPQFFGE